MISKKLGIIIFDYDGVLVDSRDSIIQSSNAFCKIHDIENRITHETLAQLDPATFLNIARHANIPEVMILDYAKILSHQLRANLGSTPIFPGVPRMIRILEQYYMMAIISANHTSVIEKRLQRSYLLNSFDIIFGNEHAGSKVDHINYAIDRTGCIPERTWMIGDTVSDIDSALSTDIHALAATWGWQSKSFLGSRNPEKLFDRPAEVLDYLTKLAKQCSVI